MDKDFIIIFALIILLMNDGGDILLIFALLFILA